MPMLVLDVGIEVWQLPKTVKQHDIDVRRSAGGGNLEKRHITGLALEAAAEAKNPHCSRLADFSENGHRRVLPLAQMPSGGASVFSYEFEERARGRGSDAATAVLCTNLERDPPLRHQHAVRAHQR